MQWQVRFQVYVGCLTLLEDVQSVLVSRHLFPCLQLDSIVRYHTCCGSHFLSRLALQRIDNSGRVRLQLSELHTFLCAVFTTVHTINLKYTHCICAYLRPLSFSLSELRMMAEGRFASLPRSLHAHHTMGGGAGGAHPGVSSTPLGGPGSACSSRRFQTSLASSMDLLNTRPRWAVVRFFPTTGVKNWNKPVQSWRCGFRW